MCGRYTLKTPQPEIAKRFLVEMSKELRDGIAPRYNITPGRGVLAVWDDRDAGWRKADFFNWGLVPSWANDVNSAYKMINARSETAAVKPAFRDAMRYRRCLLPADGFFEWKRKGNERIPYYFEVDDGQLFALAGLWEHWQSVDGSEIFSCAVLTTEANAQMAPIHDRMPVILDPGDYDRWLDPSLQEVGQLRPLLKPFSNGRMRSWQVGRAVNTASQEGPKLIEPASEEPPKEAHLDFFDKLFPNERPGDPV